MQLRRHRSLKRLVTSMLDPLPGLSGFVYRLEHNDSQQRLPEHVIEKITPRDTSFKQMSFTFAAIALSAKVATLDGPLTREKYIAFRDAFPLKGGICGKIRKLFIAACDNPTPFEHYVMQVKYIFPRRMPLFNSLVERLFQIANANGSLSPEADHILTRVAHMLELKPADFSRIRERYTHRPRAHEVLGVEKKIKSAALKKQYRDMMRRYHPDRFASEELSPEVDLLLKLKVSEINEAYRLLKKKAA
jgi:DnaJ like chaperone protein